MSAPPIDPFAPFRMDDRVAVVTGASSGFGERFARVLAAAGAKVVLAARRRERLEAIAADLDGAIVVTCDVSIPEDNERLVRTAIERHGRIDVLVNNAGLSDAPLRAEEEPLEAFTRVVDVNLNAIFQLSSLAARDMLGRRSGSIVNISSIHGLVASAPNRQAAYAASKGAVVSLTRELAVQWARKGVRVNALAPAYFETELTAEMFAVESGREWIIRNTPLGREGRIEELDGALLFLASDASSYVTGTTLAVDGGWTAR
jgi:NAD(P)-dependent dehydrogenase (short-subunit alcohol dehydrogenase family)